MTRFAPQFRPKLGRALAAASAVMIVAGCSQTASEEEGGEGAWADGGSLLADTAGQDGSRQVFFGDLHLHTNLSLDAAAAKTNTTPDDAYSFAKGETVSYLGRSHKRHAPLDFLAVTDHAEYLGNVRAAMAGDITLPGDQDNWDRLFAHEGGETMFELFGQVVAGLFGEDREGLVDPARSYDAWQETIASAERHNDPGKFTAFVAFEYSPTYRESGAHLHRNVIFEGPDYPVMPFSALDSMHHEALWAYAETNRARGMDSLMIPHNSNLSEGLAFPYDDTYGEPMSALYAERRKANEPLVEITQIKGTSETRPEVSPDDEFADFEQVRADGDMDGSFVRPGMLRGMELAEALGVNPFETGFVGATDFHSGISATEEDNYPGALGLSDDQANASAILNDLSPVIGSPLANLSASGLTGVWAESNTRESLFAAFQRRETFATSGPRMRVRLFAGWGSAEGITTGADWASAAYRWGVPMGGNLSAPPADGDAPSMIVQAAKGPHSGNLDRIQIVKLWREDGQSFEKIYNVTWSQGREIGEDGRVPAVGNTVDASTASFTNSIGAAELVGTWTDPDFEADQQALYYARVLEIPTPRWATYLSVASGIALKEGTKSWLQERAWTSPVFYKP